MIGEKIKSVEEIIAKYPSVSLDENLNKHSKRVINSKKLERANEIITKYGIPKELLNDDSFRVNEALNGKNKVSPNSKKLEEAEAFIAKHGLPDGWDGNDSIRVSGVIKEVNADKNTFVITVETSDGKKKSQYLVFTIAEKLNELVKKYWSNKLTIFIKPIESNGATKKYELIDAQ